MTELATMETQSIRTPAGEYEVLPSWAFPPEVLRATAGVDALPFSETDNILLAFQTAEDLEQDALERLAESDYHEEYQQLFMAALLRAFYLKRLRNLLGRIERHDPDTLAHVLQGCEPAS